MCSLLVKWKTVLFSFKTTVYFNYSSLIISSQPKEASACHGFSISACLFVQANIKQIYKMLKVSVISILDTNKNKVKRVNIFHSNP